MLARILVSLPTGRPRVLFLYAGLDGWSTHRQRYEVITSDFPDIDFDMTVAVRPHLISRVSFPTVLRREIAWVHLSINLFARLHRLLPQDSTDSEAYKTDPHWAFACEMDKIQEYKLKYQVDPHSSLSPLCGRSSRSFFSLYDIPTTRLCNVCHRSNLPTGRWCRDPNDPDGFVCSVCSPPPLPIAAASTPMRTIVASTAARVFNCVIPNCRQTGTKSSLIRHYTSVHWTLRCPSRACLIPFSKHANLVAHFAKKHIGEFPCSCSAGLSGRTLAIHILNHQQVQRIVACPFTPCAFTCHHPTEMWHHFESMHTISHATP